MEFSSKITQEDLNRYPGVIGLDDTPNLSKQGMQEKFEETARQVVIPKHNELIDELQSGDGASRIGTKRGDVQKELDDVNEQVNKFAGQIASVYENSHTHPNKELLDTYTENNDDIKDAVDTKHSHNNKQVLDNITEANGKAKYNGKSFTDSFSKVKVGATVLEANEEDTIELIAGENVTLTPDKNANTIVVSSTGGGGGGGTGDGDMTKAEFVLPGGSGQVLSAKTSDGIKQSNGIVKTADEVVADINGLNDDIDGLNNAISDVNTDIDNINFRLLDTRFTHEKWDALPLADKAPYHGMEITFTDDYEATICNTVQDCVDSTDHSDVAGASALVELKNGIDEELSNKIVVTYHTGLPTNENGVGECPSKQGYIPISILATTWSAMVTPFYYPNTNLWYYTAFMNGVIANNKSFNAYIVWLKNS